MNENRSKKKYRHPARPAAFGRMPVFFIYPVALGKAALLHQMLRHGGVCTI